MSDNEQRRSMDDVLTSLRRIMGPGKDADGHSARSRKDLERDEPGGALTLSDDAEALTLTEEIEPLTLTEEAEPLSLTEDAVSDDRKSVETGAGTDAPEGMSEDLDMIDHVEPVVLDEESGERARDTTVDDPLAASGHEDRMTVELDDVEPVELSDDDEVLGIDEASLQASDGEAEESPQRALASDEASADDKASPEKTASESGEVRSDIEPEKEGAEDAGSHADTLSAFDEASTGLEPAANEELEQPELAPDNDETADASARDDSDAETEPAADGDDRPLTPPDWSEDAATGEAPRVEPAEMTLPAVAGATPEPHADAALEALVRRVIREELLEGEIGQNISRNVQRLIREEVERMLARRGL